MVLPHKKKRDKKLPCVYCGTHIIQLARHLLQRHRNEEMVSKISKLQPCDPERLKLLTDLRNKGMYKNNYNVLRTGKGEIVVRRRPSRYARATDDFLPCPNCFMWSSRKFLYKHQKVCTKATKSQKWRRIQAPAANLLPVLSQASAKLKESVLIRMNQDCIYNIIKNDWLILQYGSSLCQRHEEKAEQHLAPYIATKMRELGRLLEEIQKNSNISQLADAICPSNFDLITSCTRTVAGFNAETGRLATPSLALKIGFSLAKCANLLLQEAIMSSDIVRKKIQDFLTLYESRWKTFISRCSYTSLRIMRYNKPTLLPIAEDIKMLNDFLNKQEKHLSIKLSNYFDYVTFEKLNKIILSKLILFNRKRSGETSRIFLENFKNRHSGVGSSDIFSTLSDSDKALACNFSHMQFRGKHGRTVPLLMPKSTEVNIELLLFNRDAAGIPPKNPYLFAKPSDIGFFDGGAALLKFAQECGVSEPKTLRSTNLRKHVATMTQLMNLKSNEIESVANFLGHDLTVHKQYYKLPDSAIHLAKISKLLIAVGGQNVSEFKGRDLDSMDVSYELNENSDNGSESCDDDSGTDYWNPIVPQKPLVKRCKRSLKPRDYSKRVSHFI